MDGFDAQLKAAFAKRQVPLQIVGDKEEADFSIAGTHHVDKHDLKTLLLVTADPHATATIVMKNTKTGVTVFTDEVVIPKRGDKETSDACAKDLRRFIEREAGPKH